MKKIIALLLIAGLAVILFISYKPKVNPAVADVVKRGKLIVGVKADVQGFGKLNTTTGEYEGLEIEISKLIAKEIFGDPAKIEFVPVTTKTRSTYLDNCDVDIIVATFTINDERKKQWNFSQPYYTDAIGLLVRKDSGISSIDDCGGKKIGVSTNATTQDAIAAALDAKGISAVFAQLSTYPELHAALLEGEVDVFSVDRSILSSYIDSETVLLDDKFSPQDYGVASRLNKTEFAAYIDKLIAAWKADGTINRLASQFRL